MVVAELLIDDDFRGDLARYAAARRRLGAIQALLVGTIAYLGGRFWLGSAVAFATLAIALVVWREGGWGQRRTLSRWRQDRSKTRSDLSSMGPLIPR